MRVEVIGGEGEGAAFGVADMEGVIAAGGEARCGWGLRGFGGLRGLCGVRLRGLWRLGLGIRRGVGVA